MNSSGRTTSATLYDETRRRIVDLVRDAGSAGADAPVAACPGWSVGDVVAHLAGGLGDFLRGEFGAGSYADFGERTVGERRGRSVEENLAEWDAHRADADPLFASPMAGILVTEIVSHEHDIRTALGRPGAREDEAVHVGLERPLQEIDRKTREAALPALRVILDGRQVTLGDGEPGCILRASAFEMLRVVGGRRSLAQVRSLDRDGDPEPWTGVLTPFGALRDDDLDEWVRTQP